MNEALREPLARLLRRQAFELRARFGDDPTYAALADRYDAHAARLLAGAGAEDR